MGLGRTVLDLFELIWFRVLSKGRTSGAFRTMRKEAISFVMSVRLSARNNLCPTGRIFMKFYIPVFFENLSIKLKCH